APPLACRYSDRLIRHNTRRSPMSQTKTSRWSAATALLLAAALLLAPVPAFAKTEIQFWHAMTGQLNDAVNALVKQFNESQSEYEVKPLPKGNHAEALTAAIAP